MVQLTGGQEALLQETRETDEFRRGASVQGGTTGKIKYKKTKYQFKQKK